MTLNKLLKRLSVKDGREEYKVSWQNFDFPESGSAWGEEQNKFEGGVWTLFFFLWWLLIVLG